MSASEHERYYPTARFLGGVAAALGALALTAWLTGWRVLASLHPRFIPMAPNTALAFITQGVVIALLARPTRGAGVGRGAAAASVFTVAVALSSLAFTLGLTTWDVNNLVLLVV